MLYDHLHAVDLVRVSALRRANDNPTACTTGEDDMINDSDFLNGATIEYGKFGPNDEGFDFDHVLLLKMASGESYRFTVNLVWAENGYDYAMLIGNFGALGLQEPRYKSFNRAEIEQIKKFLEAYFLSHDIPVLSALVRKARPQAFRYRDNWIIEGSGEFYEFTFAGFKPIGSVG